jgi:hypothetical protein
MPLPERAGHGPRTSRPCRVSDAAPGSDRSDLGLLFARCLAPPRPEPSAALAECLAAAFQIRAYQPEASPDAAVATIREAVAMADVLGNPSSQARFYLGNALYSLGQFDEARALLLAAREQWAAANLEFGVAWCDHELAWEAILRGAHTEATARLERALLDVYGDREASRDPLITAHLEAALAEAAARSGDHQLAERMAALAVATARGLHGRGPLVMALTRATDVAILGGDLVTASTALTELLQLLCAIGARRWVASALDATVALLTVNSTESAARAARLLGAAEGLRVVLGEAPPTAGRVSDLIEARRADAVDCLGEARFDIEIARGRRATADEALRWAMETHRTRAGSECQNHTRCSLVIGPA